MPWTLEQSAIFGIPKMAKTGSFWPFLDLSLENLRDLFLNLSGLAAIIPVLYKVTPRQVPAVARC